MSILTHTSYKSFKWEQPWRAHTPSTIALRQQEKEFLEERRKLYQIKDPKWWANASAQIEKFQDPLFDETREEIRHLLDQKISVQFFETFPPQRLATGREGNVYSCKDQNNQPAVLKSYHKKYADCYQTSLNDASHLDKLSQLRRLIPVTKMLLSSPKSPHLIKAKGLAYIEKSVDTWNGIVERDFWGIVFERIDGETWGTVWESLTTKTFVPSVIKMLVAVAKASQILDAAKWGHGDLRKPNVMIRSSDKSVVVIDIPPASPFDPKNPTALRKEFGDLYRTMGIGLHLNLDPSLAQNLEHKDTFLLIQELLKECQSEKTLDELSWNNIIKKLESLQDNLEIL